MGSATVEMPLIERRKLFEQVAAHLQRQILDGSLKPGDRLPPERDLQEQFGVGRPAIREALISLQRAGLVEIANGTRARVAMPTASGVLGGMIPAVRQMLSTDAGQRHFHDVRAFFEAGLARHAAREATAARIAALETALRQNAATIGDTAAFIETDVRFHFLIAEMSGNPVIVALHDAMSAWLKQQRMLTLQTSGQDRIAHAAHSRIFEAIRAHDPDAAEREMQGHMRQLGGLLADAARWDPAKD
jgi:GntR family transcriptional repressor for pyruvate dehydrogenase complex